MNHSITVCEKCFNSLMMKDTELAMIWLDFCQLYTRNLSPLPFKSIEYPTLQTLEEHGYISTTDISGQNLVKVNGFHPAGEESIEDFFCIDFPNHLEEEP